MGRWIHQSRPRYFLNIEEGCLCLDLNNRHIEIRIRGMEKYVYIDGDSALREMAQLILDGIPEPKRSKRKGKPGSAKATGGE